MPRIGSGEQGQTVADAGAGNDRGDETARVGDGADGISKTEKPLSIPSTRHDRILRNPVTRDYWLIERVQSIRPCMYPITHLLLDTSECGGATTELLDQFRLPQRQEQLLS